MVIQGADVTKDHVVVVINELKATNGPLTLQGSYRPDSFEAYMTDSQGQRHPISPEILRSLKPEIRSWLNRVLSQKIQTTLATPGAHIRLTAEQDKAALLFKLYRKLPD
jgi:hypothetical protein